jgi:hypothetical protein
MLFVMRADQQREGGVFALLSLILFGFDGGKHNVVSKKKKKKKKIRFPNIVVYI